MKWTIEEASIPGLYNVYDEDGNPVVQDATHDQATLFADASRTRTVLAALVADIDACETVHEFALLTSGDAMRQARAILKETGEAGE